MNSADMMMKKLGMTVSNLTAGAGGRYEAPASLDFIYGIGTEGLSQFEQAISGLKPGDSIEIEINASQVRSYFGPQSRALCRSIDIKKPAETVSLSFTLQSCETVEPKEIVTAMAEQLKEGGCGSDCGCGCGTH